MENEVAKIVDPTIDTSIIDDVVFRDYLHRLKDYSILPSNESFNDSVNNARLCKLTEIVYQKRENIFFKLSTVFSTLKNSACSAFLIIRSNGVKAEFYLGLKAFSKTNKIPALWQSFDRSIKGQFPGVKTENFLEEDIKSLLMSFPQENISSVSCVGNCKDDKLLDNDNYIQGMEKLIESLYGHSYTMLVLAQNLSQTEIASIRTAYSSIYTQLSPFEKIQFSSSKNKVFSISKALSEGSSESVTEGTTSTESKSFSTSKSTSESVGKSSSGRSAIGKVAVIGSAAAGVLAAPLTGGASLVAAGVLGTLSVMGVLSSTETSSSSSSTSKSFSKTVSNSEAHSRSQTTGTNRSETYTQGQSDGETEVVTLTYSNKKVKILLEKLNDELKHLDECEDTGIWECATYVLSDSIDTVRVAASNYQALVNGDTLSSQNSAINVWSNSQDVKIISDSLKRFDHPRFDYNGVPINPSSIVSSKDLAVLMGLPRKSLPGLTVSEHAEFGVQVFSQDENLEGTLNLGKVFTAGRVIKEPVSLSKKSLTMHTFITGSTGAGKSTAIYALLKELMENKVPFLVIEPAKGEYKHVFGNLSQVEVYGTNPNYSRLLKLNPFSFPDKKMHILEHLDRLVDIFNVCWPMYAAMPAILKSSIELAYQSVGWDLQSSKNPNGRIFPDFRDLQEAIEKIVNDSRYSADSKSDYSGALLTRVGSLTNGINSLIFSHEEISDKSLFDKNVIVDLSRIGSYETKALLMGILVLKLTEYRQNSDCAMNSDLRHVTVLEEAHNLLKRTSTEQISESANLLGKSVEMLSSAIAEMRTYGEGFVIADQSPENLDKSAIRNTNTKIILRLPDKADRDLVGLSVGLNEDQISELAKLKRGVAVVYQNGWLNPVLTQINNPEVTNDLFRYEKTEEVSPTEVKLQLLYLLVKGRVSFHKEISIDFIIKNLSLLNLRAKEFHKVKALLEEYKETGKLKLWSDSFFGELSGLVYSVFNDGSIDIKTCMRQAKDFSDLTRRIDEQLRRTFGELESECALSMIQCILRANVDLGSSIEDKEKRRGLYRAWLSSFS